MNVKKNILVPAGILVLIVIVVVPATLLFKGISEFSDATQNLDLSIQELRSLYNKEPFPSRENIKEEKTNVLAIDHWFDRMMTALQQGQILEENSTPTGFITQYGRVRNNLMSLAQRDRKLVSEDFAFGFDRYAEGSLPAPVDVARLMQQLRIVEQVTVLLIDSGVKHIVEIKREEFESGASTEDAERDQPTSRRRSSSSRRSSAGTSSPPSSATPVRHSANGLYAQQHFTVEIKATERAVLDVVNGLAAHKMFVVVTGLEFKKTGPDLRMPKVEEPTTDALSGKSPVKAKPSVSEDDQPRQKREVSGPGFETPMDVVVDFDVYTFGTNAAE